METLSLYKFMRKSLDIGTGKELQFSITQKLVFIEVNEISSHIIDYHISTN